MRTVKQTRITFQNRREIFKDITDNGIDYAMDFWVTRAGILMPCYEPFYRKAHACMQSNNPVEVDNATRVMGLLCSGGINLYHAELLEEYIKPSCWYETLRYATRNFSFTGNEARTNFREFCAGTATFRHPLPYGWRLKELGAGLTTITPEPIESDEKPEPIKESSLNAPVEEPAVADAPSDTNADGSLNLPQKERIARLLKFTWGMRNRVLGLLDDYHAQCLTDLTKPTLEGFIEYMMDKM